MTTWWTEESKKIFEQIERRFAMRLFYGDFEVTKERRKRNEDNRKWAWIIVGKTRKMVCVDNKTMKAYKTDGYKWTWMEIKKFKFERWCTSFDL